MLFRAFQRRPPNGLRLLALLSCLLATPVVSAPRMLLPTTQLGLGPHTLQVEIAATPEARAQGLMFRESLPPDHGMLFVFHRPDYHCFWMKNTPLPLSIGFFDANGHLLNLADMTPHSTDSHCPVAPSAYALEVPQGWFTEKGVAPGWQLDGLPPPAKQ